MSALILVFFWLPCNFKSFLFLLLLDIQMPPQLILVVWDVRDLLVDVLVLD